jgi:hypothetical protein
MKIQQNEYRFILIAAIMVDTPSQRLIILPLQNGDRPVCILKLVAH